MKCCEINIITNDPILKSVMYIKHVIMFKANIQISREKKLTQKLGPWKFVHIVYYKLRWEFYHGVDVEHDSSRIHADTNPIQIRLNIR